MTERSYRTAIRIAGHEVAAPQARAGRPPAAPAPSSEVAVDHRADVDDLARAARAPRRPSPRRRATPATTSGTASARRAAARRRSPRRRGTRRAPNRSRPTGPRTARSKPAWRSWPRMNSPMTRRATSVSIASSAGSSNGSAGRPPVTAVADRRRGTPIGRSIGSAGRRRRGRGSAPSSAVESGARPARSATIRASSRTCELRPLVAQQRQGDPLAADVGQRDVDHEQALVVERRRRRAPRRSARSPRSRPRTRSTRRPRPGCRRRRTTS